MKILYFHGWQSVPGGVKPTHLEQGGHTLIQPHLPDDDFGAALALAQTAYAEHQPDVVVGSSRGGAIAMNIDSADTPLVLLCPAWRRWGNARTIKPGTRILHALADEVIPWQDSVDLLSQSGLAESALITTGHDHRLSDPESLQALLIAVDGGQ